MTNDIARYLPPLASADSTQPLPSSVARALRQAEQDDHPDVPWRPPAVLPSKDALEAARALLTPEPADDRTIASCMAAMVIAFEPNTRLSAEATRLRMEVWRQATADLGSALWEEATEVALRSLKWMPRPAEFRDLVRRKLEARLLRLRRCEQMLAAHARREEAPVPRPSTTREQRLAELIAVYRKHNRPADVERLQRDLDALQRKAQA